MKQRYTEKRILPGFTEERSRPKPPAPQRAMFELEYDDEEENEEIL